MKYLALAAMVLIISSITAYIDSKFEKLSPLGKFNRSYKANFIRNIITTSVVVIFLLLIRVLF